MPYIMTHLIIAKNASGVFGKHINSLPQYYLGSLAPDAVHNREGFIYDYKKTSHLLVGEEKWGTMTNHDECKNNVIAFFLENKQSENHDFILGYCVHILSDIYHHKTITTPLMQKYPDKLGKLYREESTKLDIELALTYEGREDFWLNLAKANAVDLPGIIYAKEIDKQRHYIGTLYKDKDRQDISTNQIITYELNMDYIKNATDFVISNLQEYL